MLTIIRLSSILLYQSQWQKAPPSTKMLELCGWYSRSFRDGFSLFPLHELKDLAQTGGDTMPQAETRLLNGKT